MLGHIVRSRYHSHLPQPPRRLYLDRAAASLARACTTRVVSPERDAAASPARKLAASPRQSSCEGGAEAFVGELSMAKGAAVPEHGDGTEHPEGTEESVHVPERNGTIRIDGPVSTIGVGAPSSRLLAPSSHFASATRRSGSDLQTPGVDLRAAVHRAVAVGGPLTQPHSSCVVILTTKTACNCLQE